MKNKATSSNPQIALVFSKVAYMTEDNLSEQKMLAPDFPHISSYMTAAEK